MFFLAESESEIGKSSFVSAIEKSALIGNCIQPKYRVTPIGRIF